MKLHPGNQELQPMKKEGHIMTSRYYNGKSEI